MARWDPWWGCHRYSEGCKFCYIHKGDAKRGVDTNLIMKTDKFDAPIARKKNGEYKIEPGLVYVCFSSDFLLEDADPWRGECWDMIRERKDCQFLFLTKRIERFLDCIIHHSCDHAGRHADDDPGAVSSRSAQTGRTGVNVPSDGVLRCPKDCPERKPGCHNVETCACWAAQLERRKKERQERWYQRCQYPHSWAQRGIIKKGELKK